MISNPGRTLDTSGYMQKSIYDSTNKNKDIFSYVDSQVATRTTSSQVATQISNATSSFVTSSQVDQRIQNDKDTDPYRWRRIVCVPLKSTYSTPVDMSTILTNTSYRRAKIVTLPLAIDTSKYVYEWKYTVLQLTTNRTSDTNADLELGIGSDTVNSARNYDTITTAHQTVTTKTQGTPGSWLQSTILYGYIVGNYSLDYITGLQGQTASPYYKTLDYYKEFRLNGGHNLSSTYLPYIAFITMSDYLYGMGIWFEYRAIHAA